MSFEDALNQTIDMLRRHKRVSYRALRRQFQVDDGYIEDLKAEIIEVLKLAIDEGGHVLVWTGPPAVEEPPAQQRGAQQGGPASSDPREVVERMGAATASAPSGGVGERRHLTVMFCDLVGSTPLAERLDPEELAQVYSAWQDTCVEAVAEHEGHIADYRGDGILVYFGYPSAYEDAPHRAVRAALGVLDRLRTVNERLRQTHATTLAVRIGIHTGLVLLSDLGGRFARDHFALGETPNIAARLQALAGENQVVVSGALRNLVRGFFDFEDLGQQNLKGISRAVSISRVLASTSAVDRLQASEKGPTPFVARESELAALKLRWALTLQGHGHATLLSGEAGIGKSRLVRAVVGLAEADHAQRVIMRCSLYHRASALHPVIEHMLAYLGIDRRDEPQDNLAKLKAALESSGVSAAAREAELVGTLLNLPLDKTPLIQSLSAPQRRGEALDALVRWGLRSAASRPLLLVVEDIHWADPSTLEFLGMLLDALADKPLLVLITARLEYHVPVQFARNLTQIQVERLSDAEAMQLVDNIARGSAIPMELRQQIVARADGVPLFVEELVAMILESAEVHFAGRKVPLSSLASLPIPATLQDSLAARLDRLGEAREVGQLASALGREFSFELISAVSSMDTSVLLRNLSRLVDSELMQQRGVAPNAVYRFKHALIQEAAYQSMLKTRRQHYHHRIAAALEQRFASIVDLQPELLAHHQTEAAMFDQAIGSWRLAGEKALRRSANLEALHHLDQGLALLARREANAGTVHEEFLLQMARGTAVLMVKGQSAPEVAACFGRAYELSKSLEDTVELFTVLFGLWRSHMARGSLLDATDIAGKLRAIAERLDDPALILAAHSALSLVLYHRCELPSALAHAEAAMAVFDGMPPESQSSPIFNMGQHPALACCLCMSFILVLTGAPDRALTWQKRGVEIAQRTGIPFQIATATGWSLMLAFMRRDGDAALSAADKVLALAHEHVFPHWEFIGHFHRGILLVERGEHEEGLALARAGVGAVDKLGFGNIRVRFHALIADACRIANRPEEGLSSLRQAFASFDQSGEQWWEPELHRIEGEIMLALSPADSAAGEAHLHEAMRIARSKGLSLFQLRAATSLARALQARGDAQGARDTLGQAIGVFKEGFGTRDVVDARVLLDQLSH